MLSFFPICLDGADIFVCVSRFTRVLREMEWLRKHPRTVDVKTKDGVVRGSLLRDRELQEVVAVFK